MPVEEVGSAIFWRSPLARDLQLPLGGGTRGSEVSWLAIWVGQEWLLSGSALRVTHSHGTCGTAGGVAACGVSCPGLGVVESGTPGVVESGTPGLMTWKQRFYRAASRWWECLERGRSSTVPLLKQCASSEEKQASSPLKDFMMRFQQTLGWTHLHRPCVTLISHHIPSLTLAPVPGISPLGAGKQHLHSSARFLLESPKEIIFTLFGLRLLDSV